MTIAPAQNNLQPHEDLALIDSLRGLVHRLSVSGYADFCASFNPFAPRMLGWSSRLRDMPRELVPLVELMLLGKAVPIDQLPEWMLQKVPSLTGGGLLTKSNGLIKTRGLSLLPVMGIWLFFETPNSNPTMYFGDDSMALASRLRPPSGGRVLDLCSGPGIQALVASGRTSSVDAVEINPVAAWLGKINVLVNGLENKVSVHQGNLYEPVAGHSYDLVMANPPLLPFPSNTFYPFVGHGGDDGLSVTRKIMAGLGTFLTEDGLFQTLGTTLSDGILPLCDDEMQQFAREEKMDVVMTVTSHHNLETGATYFEGLVDTAFNAKGGDRAEIALEFSKSLEAQGASHLCAYFLTIARGAGKFRLIDLSNEHQGGLWFV